MNTEQTNTNIFTYFLSFFKTTTIPTQLLRSFQGYFIDSELCPYSMLLIYLHYYLILLLHLRLLYRQLYEFDNLFRQGVFHLTFILWHCTIRSILVSPVQPVQFRREVPLRIQYLVRYQQLDKSLNVSTISSILLVFTILFVNKYTSSSFTLPNQLLSTILIHHSTKIWVFQVFQEIEFLQIEKKFDHL